jgi:hypothetical protein
MLRKQVKIIKFLFLGTVPFKLKLYFLNFSAIPFTVYKSINFYELILAQPISSEPKIESSMSPSEQGPAHHERTEVVEPPVVKVTAYTLGEQ